MTSMPAVILAAGSGKRMGEEGKRRPKTLTPIGDTTIADTIFDGLLRAGFSRAVVVTGHLSDMLEGYLAKYRSRLELVFVNNPDFASTNNIYSLWLARDHLVRGFCLFEADVWCDAAIVAALLAAPGDNVMVVDAFGAGMNGTVVRLRPDDSVEHMVLTTGAAAGFDHRGTFKTVNLYRCGQPYAGGRFLPRLARAIEEGDVNSYYEKVIKQDIDDGVVFHACKTGGLPWWEIDTPEDAAIAERLSRAAASADTRGRR
jgi:choline kinase